MKNFFITGTDTDVGKTTIACALIQAFAARGFRAAPMKPISAGSIVTDKDGIEMNADVAALREVSASTATLSDINPYRFSEMMAPHLAAQHENVTVELDVIRAAFDRLKTGADTVLVEGAGGFLVPLSMSRSMAEIPTALSLDVIVVAGMRLGVLNHALLTVEAIRARGLNVAGWIANTTVAGKTMLAFDENHATLERMIGAPLLGTVPFDAHSNNALERARRAAPHLRMDTLLR
jgi:dethiobiotin synthetase